MMSPKRGPGLGVRFKHQAYMVGGCRVGHHHFCADPLNRGLRPAIKKVREERGWTQSYVVELVGRDSRTIMNIENKGQYPSFGVFVKLVTMFVSKK